MINNIWNQWQRNPVTISPSEKKIIMTIPFPTVTICPEIPTTTFEFDISATLKHLPNLNDRNTEINILSAFAHVCPRLPELIDFKDNFTNESIYQIFRMTEEKFERQLSQCSWLEQVRDGSDCGQYVAPVFTDNGICLTFNALNSYDTYTDQIAPEMITLKSKPNVSYWSLDGGYTDKSIMIHDPYPMRTGIASSGQSFALKLSVSQYEFEYKCSGIYQGFKVILTTPGEALKMSQNSFRVPLSEKTMVTINPKLITTSEGLRSYEPNQRQCFYQHERQLRFFKLYTQEIKIQKSVAQQKSSVTMELKVSFGQARASKRFVTNAIVCQDVLRFNTMLRSIDTR
ncbi:pickpocket protein 28-like [Sitodiplosis mosellana]|uniref:pickpocket protein 28-like n=1 Tax=Sitodiplosis mosellana TaxID=263140 RepID=UPI0024444921|nr:pickpocket protein 28-like [Sitodiplosis mosellana]